MRDVVLRCRNNGKQNGSYRDYIGVIENKYVCTDVYIQEMRVATAILMATKLTATSRENSASQIHRKKFLSY